MITRTYDIQVGEHDGFFEAYTAALGRAFEEFVIENPELVQIFTELFEASIEEYADDA